MDIETHNQDSKFQPKSSKKKGMNDMDIEDIAVNNKKSLSKSKSTKDPSKTPKNNSSCKLIACPYANYLPPEIEFFAYNSKFNILAVIRNDSTIEFWSYPTWTLVSKTFCSKSAQPKSFAWIDNDENLLDVKFIVAHINGTLSLYQMNSYYPIASKSTGNSGLWDMKIKNNNRIALSYDDGSVRIYEFDGDSDIFLQKSVRTFPEKALCVEWDQNNENILYVGYEKGLIRKFDTKANIVLLTMKLAKQDIIWTMIHLRSAELIVGSSEGNIIIFDTTFGTVSQELKTHEGDVLCLAKNNEESAIYASGIDSKIVYLQKIYGDNTLTKGDQIQQNKWIISSNDRGQSHDIKSLCLINDNLLISGGVTTDICIYKLENNAFIDRKSKAIIEKKEAKKLRHITDLPQYKVIYHANYQNQNILLFQKTFSLEMWVLNIEYNQYDFLIEIQTKDNPIINCGISHDGKYIGYSTLEETIIFKFDIKTFRLEKIGKIEPLISIIFINDNKRFIGISKNYECLIYNLHKNLKEKIILSIPQGKLNHFIDYSISFKDNIIAFGSRLTNVIYVINETMYGKFDLVEIPRLFENKIYTCFQFKYNSDCIVIAYENNMFGIYNWRNSNITKWTRQNMHKFPRNYLSKLNKIIGIICDPSNDSKMMLYTNYYMIKIHLNESIPKLSTIVSQKINKNNSDLLKNPNTEEGKTNNFNIVYRKNPIIQFISLENGKLLCIETDWKELTKKLPEAFNAKKFGM